MSEQHESKETTLVGAIWFFVAVIDVAVALSGHMGIGFFLPLAIATVMTFGVLGPWPFIRIPKPETTDKGKRSSSDALFALMELMNEGEREEFKEQLKERVLDAASNGKLDSMAMEYFMEEDGESVIVKQ